MFKEACSKQCYKCVPKNHYDATLIRTMLFHSSKLEMWSNDVLKMEQRHTGG